MIAHPVYSSFSKEMVDTVLSHEECEIDPAFPGFMDTYAALAKVIPSDYTIVDLGCAYAPQCAYFRQHAGYIGVDWMKEELRFATPNTTHFQMDILEWLEECAREVPDPCFAIANFSTNHIDIRRMFPNLFCFFPKHIQMSKVLNTHRNRVLENSDGINIMSFFNTKNRLLDVFNDIANLQKEANQEEITAITECVTAMDCLLSKIKIIERVLRI